MKTIIQLCRCIFGKHAPVVALQSPTRGIIICETCMTTIQRWKGPPPPDLRYPCAREQTEKTVQLTDGISVTGSQK